MIGFSGQSAAALVLPFLALLSACSSPGYNDNPSQKNTVVRIGCVHTSEFYSTYFRIYLQPLVQAGNLSIRKSLFRAYCNDLPSAGQVFFTAELVGNELKSTPIAIRITKQNDNGGNHEISSTDGAAGTIAEFPAQVYPKGVIETRFILEWSGNYAIELIPTTESGQPTQDRLRIPINIASDADEKASRMMSYLIILMVPASAAYWIFRTVRGRRPAQTHKHHEP